MNWADNKTIILTLLIFWIILTGNIAFLNLLLGVLVALIVSYISYLLLKKHWSSMENLNFRKLWRFCICTVQIVKGIFLANTDVGERVMDPQMPISPAVVKFKSDLPGLLPRVVLATFITLRPGTLAVDFEGDVIYVHCIADEFAKELMERKLENLVKWIFEEAQ
ncbi:Na+/H+ antiporter subunit E [Candidatus Oleimmundimicrobium sp.]|uniref:Na+/H+ antiporter subunit E n=1 Tax=Candidatus Oleimmundimicrobium sp. TaxID=3060597 RepID=UPI002723EBA5|nr:Na+/H+ antiporter subunit E [Candidatus Oleimmundimicrobium sp.]MDO8886901.1 Na+/H+ antiporter subunit E [Candidatus Oleimmundimicrobium sp.]